MAIVRLEREWLATSDTALLRRILAPDFVHIVPGGQALTRAEHLAWVAAHPRDASVRRRFVRLDVRLYGDVAIANGVVEADGSTGKELSRTAFTDVFVKRSGRWRAVNAQEDLVRSGR
ncbi:MAG: nuclear transport factor 2 family protein [Gemmatimonadota bacterium]|nr:nuclear transport factor 2 family protein [Gemmatimonadota bacterium]